MGSISTLGACGRVIDGKYYIYQASAGNPLQFAVGDAILHFGEDTDFAALFSRWQQEARCTDNSFQHQHDAYLAFQGSLLNMAYWYPSLTVARKDGTIEDISMQDVEPYHVYCFGYPLRYDTIMGMKIYTEDIKPNIYYVSMLSFMNPGISYKEAFKGAAGKTGIILDLRGNAGGYMSSCSAFLSAFIQTPYNFGRCWDNTSSYDEAEDVIAKPDPIKGFSGKIAILVNGISKSAADFAVYGMLHADVIGQVRVFGAPMAGLYSSTTKGSYSYTFNDVSETLKMGVTVEQCRTADGQNLDGYYVTPDELVDFSAEDIKTQTDPVINQALDWIQGTTK
jgi:hypothetical protein